MDVTDNSLQSPAAEVPVVAQISQADSTENQSASVEGIVVVSLDGRTKLESDKGEDSEGSSDSESDGGIDPDSSQSKSKTKDGMKCKLKQLYKSDINRHDWWDDQIPFGQEADKSHYAIIIRNIFNDDADADRRTKIHSVVVQSPVLKEILKKILDGYPGLAMNTERLTFSSPFQPLVHHWDAIKEAAAKETDETAKRHLKLFTTSLETELSGPLESVKTFNEFRTITFQHLWAIFYPGETVFAPQGKTDCVFRLKRHEYIKSNGVTYLLLHVNFVEWDGEKFGRANRVLAVPEFRDSASLSDLPAYPFRCHPKQEELTMRLQARGRRFYDLAGFHYVGYNGIGIDDTNQMDVKAFHVSIGRYFGLLIY